MNESVFKGRKEKEPCLSETDWEYSLVGVEMQGYFSAWMQEGRLGHSGWQGSSCK